MLTPDTFAIPNQQEQPAVKKVCPLHIKRLVDSLTFKFARVGNTTVTGCWAFLPNNFKVGYGESACVDPTEFNQADGEKYAKERCIQAATNKLWELEGYLLKVTGRTSDLHQLPGKPDGIPAGFDAYMGLPTTRYAYQVTEDDEITYVKDSTAEITVAGKRVQFKHYEEVLPGDYVVYLKDNDIYHCSYAVFKERNVI